MMPLIKPSAAMFLCLLTMLPAATSLAEDNWTEVAHPRLKAIYEQGAFRAKGFSADWTADGKAYISQVRDPQTNRNRRVRLDIESGEPVTADESAAAGKKPNPEPYRIQVRGDQIVVQDKKSNERVTVIKRPDSREVNYYGFRWNADGTRALLIASDQTDVKTRAMLRPTDPSYPAVQNRRFARVGGVIATLSVAVVDAEKAIKNNGEDSVQWLPLEDLKKDDTQGFYLGQTEWVGEDEVLIEWLSRFRNHRVFLLYNARTGKSQELFAETNEAWAVSSPAKNMGLIWVGDEGQFIVITERDGWRHAYLCSRSNDEQTLLTPGDFDIIDRGPVDVEGGWFYFYASPDDGTQRYLFRVPLDGSGKMEKLSPEQQIGWHDYKFSPDFKHAFHTHSTLDQPPVTSLVALPSHRQIRVLEDNSELNKKIESMGTPQTEFIKLKLSDDVTADAWMMKPKDFDPSKKYPVFVYVYGEPHGQTVMNKWGAVHTQFHQLVAELGYLVVSIDNRGTPAPKGAAWRRSIFGSLGPISTEEQAAALKELERTRPYVDLSRVGIWGWSGGGSNTLNALFRKPDVYHVGIAVVPKPQPHLYNAWFQEIYMRTREVNPEGYERAAPINFAEGLKGKLLIVTGSGETNTHIQIIEGLVDRLIEMGKPFDYMVYPNRDHGLSEGPGSRVHVRMLIIRYLKENLPSGGV